MRALLLVGFLAVVALLVVLSTRLSDESPHLPRVATVGAMPPAADRVEIGVEPAGAFTLDGRVVDAQGLVDGLRLRAREAPRSAVEPGFASTLHALITTHPRTPFQPVQHVLSALSSPETCILRVSYAVRSADGGPVGAFAWYLAHDMSMQPIERQVPPVPWVHALVELRTDAATARSAGDLRTDLGAEARRGFVMLRAPADVPMDYLLGVLDACYRAGAPGVSLAFAGPREAERVTAAAPLETCSWSVRLLAEGDREIGRSFPPARETVAPGQVGFAVDHTVPSSLLGLQDR